MSKVVIVVLRVFLVLVFLGLAVGQLFVIPTLAAEEAAIFPEVAYLAGPYTAIGIAALACIQVGLLCTWILLSKVARGAIFNNHALIWVNLIIAAAIAGTLLPLGVGIHLMAVVNAGGPAAFLGVCATAVGGAALVLLITVMRGLLKNATTLENELSEVV